MFILVLWLLKIKINKKKKKFKKYFSWDVNLLVCGPLYVFSISESTVFIINHLYNYYSQYYFLSL